MKYLRLVTFSCCNTEKPQAQIWFEALLAFLSCSSLSAHQLITIASALLIPSFIEASFEGFLVVNARHMLNG